MAVRTGTTEARRPGAGPSSRPWRTGLLPVVALGALAVVVRLVGGGRVAWAQTFLLLFGSLLVQAFPFVLLGAAVSAAIEVYVPGSVLARLGRLPQAVQLPAAGVAGMAFPVCECGSVPVGRRLAAKGLSPSAAVTFMLAAPIVNPIVLVSTAVAYRGRSTMWLMVLGRAGLGFAAAIAIGWVVGGRRRRELIRPWRGGDDGGDARDPHPGGRLRALGAHFAADTLFMGRFLLIGAAAAGAIQTFAPPSFLGRLAGQPVVDLLALMALAALLSLCSESDAFVASSFVQFGPAAQLAFLVFGPLFNLKLAALYAGTFSRGFVRTVLVVAAAVVLVGALWVEAFVR
jgi:uncharacterized membrane protein YraQ (UPF0718 family)